MCVYNIEYMIGDLILQEVFTILKKFQLLIRPEISNT